MEEDRETRSMAAWFTDVADGNVIIRCIRTSQTDQATTTRIWMYTKRIHAGPIFCEEYNFAEPFSRSDFQNISLALRGHEDPIDPTAELEILWKESGAFACRSTFYAVEFKNGYPIPKPSCDIGTLQHLFRIHGMVEILSSSRGAYWHIHQSFYIKLGAFLKKESSKLSQSLTVLTDLI